MENHGPDAHDIFPSGSVQHNARLPGTAMSVIMQTIYKEFLPPLLISYLMLELISQKGLSFLYDDKKYSGTKRRHLRRRRPKAMSTRYFLWVRFPNQIEPNRMSSFDFVRFTIFFVSLISFDDRTKSNSIVRLSSIKFDQSSISKGSMWYAGYNTKV